MDKITSNPRHGDPLIENNSGATQRFQQYLDDLLKNINDFDDDWVVIDSPYPGPANWVEFSGDTTIRYRKLLGGLVVIEGIVKNGAGVAGETIVTMPEGYRPGRDYTLVNYASGASGTVVVMADGRVRYFAGGTSQFNLFISFYAG